MGSDFTGFVLAGGKSARMGTDKSSLRLNGETFLRRAVRTLSAVCGAVKIVLNQDQPNNSEFAVIRDILPERGANGAIHAALADCETEFAVVLAVDLPLVSSEVLKNMQHLALADKNITAIVPQQANGKPQPLCAVYRAPKCLPPLANLLSENERASVRDFLERISPRYVAAGLLKEDEEFLFNVNFPEDYQKIV